MKNFIAFESARPTRHRYTFKVYQIKRNCLCYIGVGSMFYGSTLGTESEVYNFLIDSKIIPLSWRKKNGSYYEQRPTGKINISYIVPSNQK